MLSRVLRVFKRGMFHVLLSVTPRSNGGYLLFGSAFGYGDNSKYLYEQMVFEGFSKCIWVANDVATYHKLNKKGLPSVKRGSLRWLLLLIRSNAIFVTHGIGDVAPAVPRNCKVINLWHGTPIKRIGHDAPMGVNRARLRSFFGLRDVYQNWDYLLAASKASQRNLASATRLNTNQIFLAKQPRNQYLNDLNQQTSGIVLYMPTFRDDASVDHIYRLLDVWADVNKVTGLRLCIKLHPLDKVELDFEAFDWLAESSELSLDGDVQCMLANADALITDYSSVVLDFLLTAKPLIFFAPDCQSYLRLRGGSFYINLEKIISEVGAVDACDFVELLSNPIDFKEAYMELYSLVDEPNIPTAITVIGDLC